MEPTKEDKAMVAARTSGCFVISAMIAITVAGFLHNPVTGFIILAVCLILLAFASSAASKELKKQSTPDKTKNQ